MQISLCMKKRAVRCTQYSWQYSNEARLYPCPVDSKIGGGDIGQCQQIVVNQICDVKAQANCCFAHITAFIYIIKIFEYI